MKRATLLSLIALTAMPAGIAWSADRPLNQQADRQVIAERDFGAVHFVIGAGKTTKWLEMYTDGAYLAAFRDFAVEDVIASPDGKYFLAVSNASKSSLAYAIIDRKGMIIASAPHGGDLHYCQRTSWGIGEWVDTKNLQATFSIQKNQMTTPATEYLAATVRGCDGGTVILARAPPPEKQIAGATSNSTVSAALTSLATVPDNPDSAVTDRSTFFIGNTIANLRGLDPTFGARTLTLMDGRRVVNTSSSGLKALSLPASWTDAPVFQRGSELLYKRRDGSMQSFASGVVGEFIGLTGSQRIFACSYDVSTGELQNPLVLDLNSERISLPAHPGPVRICARTGSGDEVLLVYGLAEAGRSYTLARVFDANGALLAEQTFTTRGELQFNVAGKPYTATVPGP